MKNPINKRIFRQFKTNTLRIIPLVISIVLVVVFSASFFTSQDSIKNLYYQQLENGKIEDGQFTTIDELSKDLKNKLEKENIKIYENFNKDLGIIKNKNLRAFKNRKHINIAQILKGSLAKNNYEIAISGNYARANNLKINDKIKLYDKNFKITGIISLPDYSSLLRYRDDLVMDTGYFGVCLLTNESFDKFNKVPTKYTYSYHTNKNLNKKQANDKLKKLIKTINKENFVIDAITRFDNRCITYIKDDMDGDVPTMTIFMIIIFIALAFISAVDIKSLIEKESSIIGTLLASGYTKKELIINYMSMPLFITFISAIIGNIISYTYAYKKYIFLYYQSFDLPTFKPTLSIRSFLITIIIPLIIYLIINFIVIYKSLNFKPLEFLRGNLLKKKKKNKVKLNNFTFLKKFKIRIIFDNKLNIIALLFGIFLANMILIFALSIRPIFNDYAQNMKDSMKYSYNYFVKYKENNIQEDKATLLNVELVDNDDKKIQIYGVDKKSNYKIKNYKNLKDNEIFISEGLTKRYSYKINDTLKIREPYNNKEISLKIKGIDYNNSLYQIFNKRKSLNKIIDKDKNFFNVYLSEKSLNISRDNLITKIDKEEINNFMEHFLNNFSIVFDLLFIVGIGFYIIITTIISNIIIDKSKLNVSYLKIFGFNNKEITKIYINPIFILIIIFQLSIIKILDRFIKNLITLSMTRFDAHIIPQIPISLYFKAIVFSIIIFSLIQLAQRIKISKIDMVKELKNING